MRDLAGAAERVWYGAGTGAAAARAALAPLELLFRAGVAARGALYGASLLRAHALPAPAVSVGNLSVGGTGKTPVAAWVASRLADAGACPGVVLRGYGGDEPRVHSLLNPGAIVVAAPDRVEGAAEAVRRGADVLVLDDAFQHRRARRDADIVLVSAERWPASRRLLPAGPLREPPAAMRRASLVVVTRKVASAEAAARVADDVAVRARGVPTARVALLPGELRAWRGADGEEYRAPLETLRGASVLAVAAVGEPDAFFAQLRALGAAVEGAAYPDHHAFTAGDATALARRAATADRVLCTLKDAVKLGPVWPRLAPPLWYVSQRVAPEAGEGPLSALLEALLAARGVRPAR